MNQFIIKSTTTSKKKSKEIEKECWDTIAWAKKTILDDDRKSCVTPMRRVCKIAMKYDMLECVAISTTFLAHYYYTSHSHSSLCKKYHEIAKRYRKLSFIEKELIADLQPLKHKLNSNYRITEPVLRELKEFVYKAEEYIKLDSPKISSHCYMPMLRYYEIIGDHQKMKLLCNKAMIVTEKTGRQHFFQYVGAQIYLFEEKFHEANELINLAMRAVNQGTNTYCFYNLLAIKIDFYSGQFDSVKPKLVDYKWKNTSDKKIREWNMIIKGYLYFLLPNQSFKLGKFINEICIFDRDKAGIDLNILIIFYLYHLRNDKAKLIDNKDALDRYLRRYLKGSHRSFFKFLVGTIRYQFKTDVITFRMKKEINLVKKSKPNIDIEVVPYSMLIDLILDYLIKK